MLELIKGKRYFLFSGEMHIYKGDLQRPRQFTRYFERWGAKVWVVIGIRDPSNPYPEWWILNVFRDYFFFFLNVIVNTEIFRLGITIKRFKLKEIGGNSLERWNTCRKWTVHTKSYPGWLYFLWKSYIILWWVNNYCMAVVNSCCKVFGLVLYECNSSCYFDKYRFGYILI